jgi:quercetin dioxygenase-like cupin family protein
MDTTAFTQSLTANGFTTVTTVSRPADGWLDTHTHPFEARALITQGDIRLDVGGQHTTYRAGDVFHLPALVAHAEWVGPQGVTYIVGRR